MTVERNGFARIPDWLYREAVPALALTPREVAVFVVLVGRSDADGVCWPSQDLIAHEAGLRSRRSVRDALDALAKAQLVTVTKGTGRQGTRYRVMPKPPLPEMPPFVVTSRSNGVKSSPFQPVEQTREWGQFDSVQPGEWGQKDPWNGDDLTPEVDTRSRPIEVDPGRNNALPRRSMTSPQRENVLDALLAVAGRCESIDVMQFRDAELAHLDGLAADERRARITAWVGLRTRAHADAGEDLVEDDRLHDLLAAHGYVWPGPSWPTRTPGDPDSWAADHPRKEAAR